MYNRNAGSQYSAGVQAPLIEIPASELTPISQPKDNLVAEIFPGTEPIPREQVQRLIQMMLSSEQSVPDTGQAGDPVTEDNVVSEEEDSTSSTGVPTELSPPQESMVLLHRAVWDTIADTVIDTTSGKRRFPEAFTKLGLVEPQRKVIKALQHTLSMDDIADNVDRLMRDGPPPSMTSLPIPGPKALKPTKGCSTRSTPIADYTIQQHRTAPRDTSPMWMEPISLDGDSLKLLHTAGKDPSVSTVPVSRSMFDSDNDMTAASLRALNFCDAVLGRIVNAVTENEPCHRRI